MELAPLADRCPGYAMCRTDFLGIGICPAGRKNAYAAFYPQGRLRVISAFRRGALPVTPALFQIAQSCVGCGICDKQCYFVAELEPQNLFTVFSEYIDALGGPREVLPDDDMVMALSEIVGDQWVSRDPAIRVAYARARSPQVPETMPRYVVLPASTGEVASLVQLCARVNLPYLPRGSGTSFCGAITDGLVIDMTRMDAVEIDKRNWRAIIGPGVTAFSLQHHAWSHDMRANVAEPAACVCANVINTNMHSLFSYAYGIGADHVIDAEFVDPNGTIARISEREQPNPFVYRERDAFRPGICTKMSVKLYPKSTREETVLVPFGSLSAAADAARQLAEKRIGVAMGVLGSTYMSYFAGHTHASSEDIRLLLEKDLGINNFLLIIGDRSVLQAVREIAGPVIDANLISKLLRTLPVLRSGKGFGLLTDYGSGPAFYKEIFSEEMRPMLEMALESIDRDSNSLVKPSMNEFFKTLYRRREMFDPVWLNSFRILPARMGRGHQFASQVVYLPLEPGTLVADFSDRLSDVGKKYGIEGSFGYFVPLHQGIRAVAEFDYYYDQTNKQQCSAVTEVLSECKRIIKESVDKGAIVCAGSDLAGQGMTRSQSYLFVR